LAALLLGLRVHAHAQSVDELNRMLIERDATIQQLRERIQALEKEAASARAVARGAAPEDADDEEAGRALERTLVQQGGLVIRSGTYELEPQLSYAHWDKRRSAIRHTSEAAIGFRAGLPWESQFQMRVPYVHVRTAAGSETALGDIDFSLSKQLTRDRGFSPGLIASLGWLSRTGEDGFDGGVPTGGGFDVLQAGFTAVKRHDPLVFFGGLSYASPLSREISGVKIEPGDTVGVRLGSILAASPETSANVGLNLGFVRATRLDGQRIPESDTVLGTLQIGFGTILTRRVLLNISGDFRVTGDVPNFRLSATLPVRF
jgi:uncharacterized coiled-coil protein SlyX